jgi:hypothetical protein
MTIRLPKQDQATVKVAFQCGVEVGLILVYHSDTNQYSLLITPNPDDKKTGYPMEYLSNDYFKERFWRVYRDERYYREADGRWYDVYAYVAENDDSYDIRIKLHECYIKAHEE